MLTVDTPVVATKYAAGDQVVWDVVDPALLRVNFDAGYEDAPGAEKATDLGPHDLDWLAEQTGLPVVAKGVLRARRRPPLRPGRRRARSGSPTTAAGSSTARRPRPACLPAVVAEAVDGAARSTSTAGSAAGLDVLAALALGADAVFLGRLPLYALSRAWPAWRGCTRDLARGDRERSGWPAAGPSRTLAESPSHRAP